MKASKDQCIGKAPSLHLFHTTKMHEFYDTLFHKRTHNFIMRYQLFFRKFYPPLGAWMIQLLKHEQSLYA